MTTQTDTSRKNIETVKELRAELRRTGFTSLAYVTLQGPAGVENHVRVSMNALSDALSRANRNNDGKLRAIVSYDDDTRYISIDGWQAGEPA